MSRPLTLTSLRLPPDRTVALVITPRCLLRLLLIDEPDVWFDDGITLHQFLARRSFLSEDQSLYYYIPRIVTLFFGDSHFTHREQIWQWLEGLGPKKPNWSGSHFWHRETEA